MSIYDQRDPRFRSLIHPNAQLRQIGSGFEWAEGPVWFPAAQMLLFSDIPAHRMMRWTAETGCTVFREDSDYSNGNTRDPSGRLVTCHHGLRAVTRTEHDGRRTVLASHHAGKRLNSPNDVIARSDGSVWFTDPTYGILSDLEGYRASPEQDGSFVYRISPEGGDPVAVVTDFTQPNGLCFSPDERLLYVAESGSSHNPDVPPVIRVFDVSEDGTVGNGRDFAMIDKGLPDGIRCDARGNLWSSAADGVHVFAPDGALLGKVLVPEVVSNICFGGPRGNRLFITATTSLYVVAVDATAAGWPA
ncbi:SMP-30/gluconolactonase/LRE family protein [Paracoccus aestuariivivens]|uniref:SMP-30/gluconolactonase/LRE family protein n=1 Tax=Paracoccus aestuariivivens TaxID=1820333 RepID=A0A6L6J5Z6_9RHOB|nr:SMP-30/gluconolactonase/LRE family protein [Paracoccus aestuariivivens]MTH76149.1 SMP-30/gluconolactonase/LRE family protein [Paracoccus aestuariivivens]